MWLITNTLWANNILVLPFEPIGYRDKNITESTHLKINILKLTHLIFVSILSGTKVETLSATVSFEDREAAYLAARERIFSTENDDVESLAKERPRSNPVVAQRMIAHALGQRIKQSKEASNEVRGPSDGQTSMQTRQNSNVQHHISRKEPQNLASARKHDVNAPKHNLKEEHIGAAKRMFANALRMNPAKDTYQTKKTDKS